MEGARNAGPAPTSRCLLTCSITHSLPYSVTCVCAFILTFFLTFWDDRGGRPDRGPPAPTSRCLLTHLPNHLRPTYLLAYSVTYGCLLNHLLSYLRSCVPAYVLTCFLTYLRPCLLAWGGMTVEAGRNAGPAPTSRCLLTCSITHFEVLADLLGYIFRGTDLLTRVLTHLLTQSLTCVRTF